MKQIVFSLMFALASQAQQYSIDWYKISGGGGTSTGATLSGERHHRPAGREQRDKKRRGPVTGTNNYSLTGGFWALISVVQTSGAPTLTISHSGDKCDYCVGPSPATGFTLQQNDNLSAANWTASGFMVNSNGTTMSITIPSPAGNLFFRLKN